MPLPIAERSIDGVYDAVMLAFVTWMATESATTEIAYENDGFDPDEAFDSTDPHLDQWVRITMAHTPGLGGAAGLGSVYRRFGTMIVQCFVRVNTGRLRANTQAEAVIKFFETRPVGSGIWFRNASPGEAGDDGAWYQINVSAEFIYDTLRV